MSNLSLSVVIQNAFTQVKKMTKRTKTIIILAMLFIVVNSALYLLIESNKEQRIQIALKNHLDRLETNYEIFQHMQDTTAKTIYYSTIGNPRVIEILSKAKDTISEKEKSLLRDDLHGLLKTKYEIAKIQGILQCQFVLLNNESFLRMHKPNQYGDDLTDIREDFKYVNETQKPIRGFVQGKTAHGFRNVFPLFDKNGIYIGAMDVTFSSEHLQKDLNDISKIHTHFLVNKYIFDEKFLKRDDWMSKYNESAEHKDYMITMEYQHAKEKNIIEDRAKLKPIRAEIDAGIQKGEKFSLYTAVHLDNHVDAISFYPIKNITKSKTVAWLVSYEESDFIYASLHFAHSMEITTLFSTLLLFYFIYWILNQKEILNMQVNIKTKSLFHANAELSESQNQLKLLNANLENQVKMQLEEIRKKEHLLIEQSKLAQMGDMINMIAHQWRQPLNAMSVSAINLSLTNELNMLDKDSIEKTCKFIQQKTQDMSKIINDFMEFNKPDTNKEFFLFEPVNEVRKMISVQLTNRTIALEVTIAKDMKVYHNSKNIEHVLLNLIVNSRDAFEDNKEIENKKIKIFATADEDSITLTVEDNAGGIPENIIDKVFNPYFTTKEQGKGTGVGLYMSKQMIENINGATIDVEVIDNSTLFRIKFKRNSSVVE